MSVDKELLQINDRIQDIDTEINRLSALKRKLIAAKEKLQDKKYLEKRNELSQNEWDQGKSVATMKLCCFNQ